VNSIFSIQIRRNFLQCPNNIWQVHNNSTQTLSDGNKYCQILYNKMIWNTAQYQANNNALKCELLLCTKTISYNIHSQTLLNIPYSKT